MKTFQEYYDAAMKTVAYPLAGKNMMYPAIKLAGEAGEAADKIGKHVRNKTGELLTEDDYREDQCYLFAQCSVSLSLEEKRQLIRELGDVLWYIAALAYELNVPLEKIAEMNIEKLTLRHRKGTLLGEGDNRECD